MSFPIKLQQESILKVPIINYQHDFTFIVNDEIYQTNKLVADLLSTKICQLHQVDPTVNEYYINTKSKGNFQNILSLATFEPIDFSITDKNFVLEIIDQLSIESAELPGLTIELTIDNVIELIKEHEKSPSLFPKELDREIDFLSTHFNEIQDHQDELFELSDITLERIINNEKIKLENEDQLLNFINNLYIRNVKYSNFYEYVYFYNVSIEFLKGFFEIFNINDITNGTWLSLVERFSSNDKKIEKKSDRYEQKQKIELEKSIDVQFSEGNLKGIFNYIRTHLNMNKEVKITTSSTFCLDSEKLTDIENTGVSVWTLNVPNSWVSFNFKKHKIILKNYTIRSFNSRDGHPNLRSWVIEASSDGYNWEVIAEENDCQFLNGSNFTHTFSINKLDDEKEFNFIRLKQTGPNYSETFDLALSAIEFYGYLV